MPRAENKATPKVESGYLYTNEESFPLDSPRWQVWLADATLFYFESPIGTFTASKESRKGFMYWYAYRRQGRKLHKAYLGKSEDLTADRLVEVARQLADMVQS